MDQREQFLVDYRRGHFSMQELCMRLAINRKRATRQLTIASGDLWHRGPDAV